MFTAFIPDQAVDPNLQAQASQVLHWHYCSDTRVELRQPVIDRRADGFDRHSFPVLGVIEYDAQHDHWVGIAGLPGWPRPQEVVTRFLLPLAQQDLCTYLQQHQLL